MTDKNENISHLSKVFVQAIPPYVAKSMQDIAHSIRAQAERYAPLFQEMEIQLRKQTEQMAPFLREINEYLRKLPEALKYDREVALTLARNGWYIDPEIPADEPFALAKQFEAGNSTQANEDLTKHYDLRLDDIEKSLCESFPEKAKLLHSAFDAHRRKEYGLSIPVFLSQADGICFLSTEAQLYSKRDGKTQLALKLVLDDESFLACWLAPLVELMPIAADTRKRSPVIVDTLNRHAVLHGIAVDYGTRINSCRAISLLVFVAWVLQAEGTKVHLAKTMPVRKGHNNKKGIY